MITLTYTHKGWFGLCPVHIGGLDTEAPLLKSRHWLLEPLFVISEFIFVLVFLALELMRVENPGWPIKVTGELVAPIVQKVACEEGQA